MAAKAGATQAPRRDRAANVFMIECSSESKKRVVQLNKINNAIDKFVAVSTSDWCKIIGKGLNALKKEEVGWESRIQDLRGREKEEREEMAVK